MSAVSTDSHVERLLRGYAMAECTQASRSQAAWAMARCFDGTSSARGLVAAVNTLSRFDKQQHPREVLP
ncbi:MAG: hypothetical protein ABSC94_19840 [Polyangiaceae bacterium]|jgi:hypothetical protein